MKGTHVLSRLGDGDGEGNVDRDGDKDWAHTWQGMYALRLCTQNNQELCVELPQYKHSIHKGGRGSEARETQ